MNELDKCRKEIDLVDRQLVQLFLERMSITDRVGAYKRAHGIPVLDVQREQEVLKNKRSLAPDEASAHEVEALYETIMGLSRARQRELMPIAPQRVQQSGDARVIYQGEVGAYTEQAAIQHFGARAQIFPTLRWIDVFAALQDGSADYGVLPIENSTTGAITQVYDLLAKGGAAVVGEEIVQVRHCLMGLAGSRIDELDEVFSHPQGFYQCGSFLSDKHFVCTEMGNNALAAQHVAALQDPKKAAIASAYAAEVYGLTLLAEGINDATENRTRFLIVQSREKAQYLPEADKISMLFCLPHRSGSLFEVMKSFADRGLNLLKLESRPLAGRPWEYLFFVDFSGNLNDDAVKQALADLEKDVLSMQILGNYKGVSE